MSRSIKQYLQKMNKPLLTGITMRFRLFLFLMVLVLTMVAGIVVILLVTGTFSAGISESKQLIKNELEHTSREISEQYGQLSVQAVEFSNTLTQKIENHLKSSRQSFSQLTDNPRELEDLVVSLYELTSYNLLKSNCSGAFFILNTTVNSTLDKSDSSKAGLYIKNMEPNIVSASSPNLTILRGFPEVARANSLGLHTQWSMEFDVKDAPYYSITMDEATNHKDLPLSKLYYWSEPLTLPGTSEEVMLISVPLIDSRGRLLGVCGFDVSSMLFKLTYMNTNSIYSRLFCMLSPMEASTISIRRSMFSGGYSVKDLSEENKVLEVVESKDNFFTYVSNNDNIYLGFHKEIQLYASDSPYFNSKWINAILVPKEDIVDSITTLNIILVCLLCLLVTVGFLISIIFSNKYLKPISQGIEMIKSAATEELPKTNVQEIDDLIRYLADYKNEMKKKAEQEKQQISLLEQFVENTQTLTPAERSVFNLYMKGLSAKEIADELFLSINTIKTHSKRIFSKLGVATREELLLYINMLKDVGQELK